MVCDCLQALYGCTAMKIYCDSVYILYLLAFKSQIYLYTYKYCLNGVIFKLAFNSRKRSFSSAFLGCSRL